MPIAGTDIQYYLSNTTATAGFSVTQNNPNASLGKYVSTTAVSATTYDNIFDDISGAENAASTVDYRCIFVLNNHGSITLKAAVVWVSAETAGGASTAIAVDNIAASSKTATSAQAASISSETTAPTGVGAFSAPTSQATGLALGDIGPGQVRAIWLKRTAANTAAQSDGFSIQVQGDTIA